MLTAVVVFGVESEAEGAGEPTKTGAPAHAIAVTETEFKIQLPSTSTLSGGQYTFEVKNTGKIEHDLAVKGPGISGVSKTNRRCMPKLIASCMALIVSSRQSGYPE